MSKIIEQNLILGTNEEATFGDNDEGSVVFNGTNLVISTTAGMNIKLEPANRVVLDGVAFPTGSGIYGQTLTLSGTYDAQWGDFS